jgi:hypothetical protein
MTHDDLDVLRRELRAERARLSALIERAERSLARRDPAAADAGQAPNPAEGTEARAGRRGFLRLAGAAAAGVGLSTVVARPALAVGEVIVNQDNPSNAQTSITRTSAGTAPPTIGAAVRGVFAATSASGDGVQGLGSGTAGAGVFGESAASAGYGVYGSSTTGYALYAGGNGRLGMVQHVAVGPPASGQYAAGDQLRDGAGNLWACVVGGTPGTFRKLAGPAAAGQLHFVTPTRIYDSRPGFAPQGGEGPFGNGTNRLINTSAWVPAGATSVVVSVSVFDIGGDGFLSLYSADLGASPGTVNVYWGRVSNHQIANTSFTQVSAARSFRMQLTSTFITVSVAVDLLGYCL